MPITGPARDQYLATIAKIIDSGAVRSKDALEVAAHEVAKDLAKSHQLTEQDLFELTPKSWLTDPASYGVAQEARALLAIAQPVLNVPMAVISPIATRSVHNAKEADLRIVFARSDAVKNHPRPPEFLEEIDLANAKPAEVKQKLEALFAHPRFADLFGVKDARQQAHLFENAARMGAGLVQDIQRKGAPGPDVRAGGVPVSGPAYEARLVPVGAVASLPQKTSVAALAYQTLRAMLVVDHMSESTLRGAITGKDSLLQSGRRPTELLVLRGVHGDPEHQIALSFDTAVQQQFQGAPDDNAAVASRLLDAVTAGFRDFNTYADAWVPYALIYNDDVRSSGLVAERLKARNDAAAAGS